MKKSMKPLKILIGNNTLSFLVGSETWSQTLAIQLKKMGHDVYAFSPHLGIISDNLKKEGIPCYSEIVTTGIKPFSYVLEEPQDHKYDVIIASHFHITDYLRSQFPDTPIISVIHGVIHFMNHEETNQQIWAPEHPAVNTKVDQYVAVSEEVQKKIKDDYGLDSMIVRQFFDVEKFTAQKPVTPGKPARIMTNTNYHSKDDPEIQTVKGVADHYGSKLIAVGAMFARNPNPMLAIESADVMFARGRSVFEAVCAGRLGIVHGGWGTGGVICPENIEQLRYCNFSGRNATKLFSKEELIELVEKYYTPENLEWGMNYIRREHNVVYAAEVFVQTARMLMEEKKPDEKEVRRIPYKKSHANT